MKKILLFTLVTLFSVGLFAQTTENQTENTAEITFAKVEHSYGIIEQGANGTCEFEFTNTGKDPIVLTNVQASCGCTTPEWPREPIKSGEKSKIVVKYNTNSVGSFRKTIRVFSNAKTNPVVLTISGEVKPKTQS